MTTKSQKNVRKTALLFLLLLVVGLSNGYTDNRIDVTAPEGAINGLFSVSPTQQVWFSRGNLQYRASTNRWRFALNQYDVIGTGNQNISSTYSGWIDLFGWGTSGYNHGAVCYQPWSTSMNSSDYYAYGNSTCNLYDQTGLADWGYNAISNGGNTVNTWRTMTKEELDYLFNQRTTSSGIRFAKARVNNVDGVILLPDDWKTSWYTLNNTNDRNANFNSNTITYQWSTLEHHGAVFLPAAGYRWDNHAGSSSSSIGEYWTASSYNNNTAYSCEIADTWMSFLNRFNRYFGGSVRLVKSAPSNKHQIGSGWQTASWLPSDPRDKYSLTQQIYTADEMGPTCIIEAIAFYNDGTATTPRNYEIFMVNTDKTEFIDNYDWIAVSEADKVFSGEVVMAASAWTTINLTTPFTYEGANWVLVVYDHTFSTSTGMKCSAFETTGYQAIGYYSNYSCSPYSLTNLYGGLYDMKNQIVLTLTEIFDVGAIANPGEGGVVNGTGTFQSGSTCTLSAVPNEGYAFANWTENGEIVSTEATYGFTVNSNRNLVANFIKIIPGQLYGVFSVGEDSQVFFSQGNLQYNASSNTWRFALHQYDCIGTGNENISSTYSGWIDLFGWGTSGYNHGAVCYQPWSTSEVPSDYYAYGSDTYNLNDCTGQADWGFNAISNGGDTTNTWRNMTVNEWSYLFYSRATSSGIRFAMARVNNKNGVILLPDDWTASYYSLSNTNDEEASYNSNIISYSQWNTLEQHGAVFLPTAGYRIGLEVGGVNDYGTYWSSTCYNSNNVWYIGVFDNYLSASELDLRSSGCSVRLVHQISNDSFNKEVSGYGVSEGGYQLIAPPIDNVNPLAIVNMTVGDFDLYYFDQSESGEEWRNYKTTPFNLESGKGYLYAHKTDVTLTFTGTPYNGDGQVTLLKTDSVPFAGWNLVGNPYTQTAYITKPFFTMNEDGSEVIPCTSDSVAAMGGIFVIADTDGEPMSFSTEAPAKNHQQIVLNIEQNRGASSGIIDRAIVRFNEGGLLPKFSLHQNSTRLYFPKYDSDYAVIRADADMGEELVNFKASENGVYTMSLKTDEISFSYLHLIDNMAGSDVNLLVEPCYTFEAKTTDYASRFKLVFATGSSVDSESDSFAFLNSSGNLNIFGIEGEATLQVVDVLGHILSSETFSGSCEKKLNVAPGVYLLRLINGDNVKVQKIIIK